MAFDYDETNPLDSSYIADFPANERAHRVAVLGSVAADHDAEGTGKHSKVTLIPLGADPSLSSTSGFLYTKEIATITELFYMDEGGQVIQLTDNGSASPDKVAVAGDEMTGALQFDNAIYVEGRDVGDANYRALIGVDASDVCDVGDQSLAGGLRLNADGVDAAVVAYGSGDKKIYHAGQFNTPIFTDAYESAEIAFVSGASHTGAGFAHGIGSRPLLWFCVLRCVSADAGWPAGAEITVGGSLSQSHLGSDVENFITVLLDDDTFHWVAPLQKLFTMRGDTGAEVELADSKWRLVFYAWY